MPTQSGAREGEVVQKREEEAASAEREDEAHPKRVGSDIVWSSIFVQNTHPRDEDRDDARADNDGDPVDEQHGAGSRLFEGS